MAIAQDDVDRLRASVSIVDVVGEVVQEIDHQDEVVSEGDGNTLLTVETCRQQRVGAVEFRGCAENGVDLQD